MITSIIINLIAVFFAWLESINITKHGLKVSIFTIFLFLGIRYDYGNDYMNYLAAFDVLSVEGLTVSTNLAVRTDQDYGWIILNMLFKPIGFFGLILSIAAFNSLVIYKFIKRYVPSKYYWFSLFVYVFSPYMMLITASAIRQSIAISIFLLSINYLIDKKILKYLVLITVASFFHKSAFVLYLLIILPYINIKFRLHYVPIAIFSFIILVASGDPILYVVQLLVGNMFLAYETFLLTDNRGFGGGVMILYYIFIYTIIMFYAINDRTKSNLLMYYLALVSLFLLPIIMILPMADRINFYFTPILIAVYPMILTLIKSVLIRFAYLSVIIVQIVYMYYSFFQSNTWIDSYSTYQTIFNAHY
jgi:transmembrane protein EpsG